MMTRRGIQKSVENWLIVSPATGVLWMKTAYIIIPGGTGIRLSLHMKGMVIWGFAAFVTIVGLLSKKTAASFSHIYQDGAGNIPNGIITMEGYSTLTAMENHSQDIGDWAT